MNKDGSTNKSIAGWTIIPLIDAACCIANKNSTWDKQKMFDTVKKFGGEYAWLGQYVRERLAAKGITGE